mgnify:CR=1 FL=1
MLTFFLYACSFNDGDANIGLAQMYIEKFSDFEAWSQDPLWEGIQPSQSAHGTAVQIWLNDLAILALESGEVYPDGAAIMKEGYVDEEGMQRKALTLMVKREGFAPDTGDWFWASYSDTDEVQMAGTPEMCVSCHAASSSDYVLFVEEE